MLENSGFVDQVGPAPLQLKVIIQKNVRNPNHHYFSKKYLNTPPICIAMRLPFVSQYFRCPYALGKGKYCQYASILFVSQYTSHLYCNMPPICIALLFGKSWWLWSPGCSPIIEGGQKLRLRQIPVRTRVPLQCLSRGCDTSVSLGHVASRDLRVVNTATRNKIQERDPFFLYHHFTCWQLSEVPCEAMSGSRHLKVRQVVEIKHAIVRFAFTKFATKTFIGGIQPININKSRVCPGNGRGFQTVVRAEAGAFSREKGRDPNLTPK